MKQCELHALLLMSTPWKLLLGVHAPVHCTVPETGEGIHHKVHQLHCRAASCRDQLGCLAAIPFQQDAPHLHHESGDCWRSLVSSAW